MHCAKNCNYLGMRQPTHTREKCSLSPFNNKKCNYQQSFLGETDDNNTTVAGTWSAVHSRVKSDIYAKSEQGAEFQMYTPTQNIHKILKDFQLNFKKLLKITPFQYNQLTTYAQEKFQLLKQIISHYQKAKHLPPYYHQLHINSTDTKNNLLKMLNQQQKQARALKQQNNCLNYEIEQIKNLIEGKELEWEYKQENLKKLEQKVKEMGNTNDKIGQYQQQIISLRDELRQKQLKIRELEGNKQKIMNDLNQIQNQMKTLNFLPASENCIPQNRMRERSCIKLGTNKNIKSKLKTETEKQIINEDLYRCMLLQALTIEQQMLCQLQ